MKLLLFLLVLLTLVSCANNLGDTIDENNIPQEMEERDNELVNSPDYLDDNFQERDSLDDDSLVEETK